MMWQTPLKSVLSDSSEASVNAIHEPSKFIIVTCRLKPLFLDEEKSKIEIDNKSQAIILNDPTKSISKAYSFDQIFDETVQQDHFTNQVCEPLVGFLKNGGESGLIFSYGITNSGKTYTILGTKEQPGILLTLIKKLEEEFKDETLRIVACELYKDEFFSLKNKGEKIHPKELRGIFTFDECHSDIINENNMQELFSQYLTNRSCSSNNYNTVSSRSHAIFKITSQKFRIGIVDLAGSERTAKGNDSNVDIKETVFINKSLLTLKKCIKSLEEKSQMSQKICIPYRESKLTQSLVEYFVPNSKINIIVNINQARHCLEQNLIAMEYTSKTKNITANVMSDFAQMLKATAKKKEEIIVAVKSYKTGKSSNKNNLVKAEGIKCTNSKTGTNGKNGKYQTFSSKQKQIDKKNENEESEEPGNQTEELYEVYKELESIEEIFDEHHKKSEHFATTVCETELTTSNILVEEIECNEFNPEKRENEHKIRYSVQFVGEEHKYVVDDEIIENEELQQSLLVEIEQKERESFIEKKQTEQLFEEFVEKPECIIEDFIKKQEEFRNYLAFDREFEAEADARKLSALRKVNFFETTKKKESPSKLEELKETVVVDHHADMVDISVGTDDLFFDNRRKTEQLNETIENLDFEKLKTNVKRKLLQILKDDEKKRILNKAEDENINCYSMTKKSEKKSSNKKDKFKTLQIDETEVENEESNFTTPSKNMQRQKSYHMSSKSERKNVSNLNSQVNQSILKKTFDKVASGVKSGVKFMADKVGLGGSIFKTNSKVVKSLSVERKKEIITNPKCEMKIWKEISEMIEPMSKIYFENQTSQEVQVTSSFKKMRSHSENLLEVENNEFSYPELEQKEIEIQVFEVATQTEESKIKFVLEETIEKIIHEEKVEEKKKKNFKKSKKQVKIQEISHESNKKEDPAKEELRKKEIMEKTAFKCTSIKKDMSLKKRPEVLSITKSVIAHKTRGARRKHDHK